MNLALIGNCSVQALLDQRANVVWLCLPRFDSSFVFGSLVGGDELGGGFAIEFADGEADIFEQKYKGETAIVSTTLSKGEHAFEVVDFAPRLAENDSGSHVRSIIRRLRPVRGTPTVRVRFRPRSDWGRSPAGEDVVQLDASAFGEPIKRGEPFALTGAVDLVLSWSASAPPAARAGELEAATTTYWNQWVAEGEHPSEFRQATVRSAITLKLHQFEPTGAFTAATTTSVPEYPGSGRNWDYRLCWPRDAFFTLQALVALGHRREIDRYLDFIEPIVTAAGESLQPLYGIDGASHVPEVVLGHLPGVDGSGRVRIGNGAASQRQYDVFGEVLATVSLSPSWRARHPELVATLLNASRNTLGKPDAGLWEKRDDGAVYTFTSLAHWLGARCAEDDELVARAAHMIESTLPGELAAGADASLLLLAVWGFARGERADSIIDVIRERLGAGPGLLYRYRHDDGLGPTHAAFTACSMWLAEALGVVGRRQEGREVLATLLGLANHVGLFSEDIDPQARTLLGNFPQTYSHAGLITASLALA